MWDHPCDFLAETGLCFTGRIYRVGCGPYRLEKEMGWTKKISQAGCPVPIPPCSPLLPLRLPRSELAACLRGPCLSDHSPSPTPPPLRAPPPPRSSPRVASAPARSTAATRPVLFGGRRCAGVTARGVHPALRYRSSQPAPTSYRSALAPSQVDDPFVNS